jgi:hypothetical protein
MFPGRAVRSVRVHACTRPADRFGKLVQAVAATVSLDPICRDATHGGGTALFMFLWMLDAQR